MRLFEKELLTDTTALEGAAKWVMGDGGWAEQETVQSRVYVCLGESAAGSLHTARRGCKGAALMPPFHSIQFLPLSDCSFAPRLSSLPQLRPLPRPPPPTPLPYPSIPTLSLPPSTLSLFSHPQVGAASESCAGGRVLRAV